MLKTLIFQSKECIHINYFNNKKKHYRFYIKNDINYSYLLDIAQNETLDQTITIIPFKN